MISFPRILFIDYVAIIDSTSEYCRSVDKNSNPSLYRLFSKTQGLGNYFPTQEFLPIID